MLLSTYIQSVSKRDPQDMSFNCAKPTRRLQNQFDRSDYTVYLYSICQTTPNSTASAVTASCAPLPTPMSWWNARQRWAIAPWPSPTSALVGRMCHDAVSRARLHRPRHNRRMLPGGHRQSPCGGERAQDQAARGQRIQPCRGHQAGGTGALTRGLQ